MKSIALFTTLTAVTWISGSSVAADAPKDAAPPASASPVQPLPLVPGAKVVTLWPAGHPTLNNVDQKEVFKTSPGDPPRVQSVTNVNNPSIELHLAPAEKANGMAVV